jgi:F-type H+-transporting ATPase subunit b
MLLGTMLLGLTLGMAAAAQTSAPAGSSGQPMTNGAPGQKMDAGETDKEMEAYRHSSTVQAIAHVLHISVERAAQIFEDFNSGLLILAIGYFLVKFLPKAFQARRSKIDHDLADARSATELANQRLQAVEARLAALDGEIEAIRQHAAHDSEGDQKRIAASLEEERARIIRSAEQEIGAAQAAAQRELKRFAADLAVDRAMTRIELTPDDDRVLVHDFTESLATKLHPGGYQKRGQN